MSKRQPELFLVDILVAIDFINTTTAEVSFDQFVSDAVIFNATLQSLTVIGEAANMLLDTPEFLEGSKTDWRKVVDFRNIVVHKYFGIDYDYVFWIVREKIPELEQDIFNLMDSKPDKQSLLFAIQKIKDELSRLHRNKSISYLQIIEGELRRKA